MSLDFLPKEIEGIIIDYKNQLDTSEKYKKVIDDIKEESNYRYPIYDNITCWGNVIYHSWKLYGSDVLLIMDEYDYAIFCIIYEDKSYYDQGTIEFIMYDLLHYENYQYPPTEIDDVDEDWIWNDMANEYEQEDFIDNEHEDQPEDFIDDTPDNGMGIDNIDRL